jgi:DNA-binding response OmpR family regulator
MNREAASTQAPRMALAAMEAAGPPLDDDARAGATAEDARSWIRVYTELVGIRRRRQRRRNGDAGDALLDEYGTRLEYWYERLERLVGIDVDSETRAIRNRQSETPLTRREFQLLSCLLQSPGVPMTSAQLLGEAWHRPDLSSEQLRIYVFRLRAKLARAGVPYMLLNDRKRGYRLEHQPGRGGQAA